MSGQPSLSRLSMEVFDNEVVPSSLQSIAPILRVASEIQNERPRVAYLCRLYAFEKADRLDPTPSGLGVRRFKTGLLQQLERDDAPSLAARVKKTDAREILSFYKQYYEHYVLALNTDCVVDRAELGKAYQTAGVLFEVLCAVNKTEKVDQVSAENMTGQPSCLSMEVFDNEVVPSSEVLVNANKKTENMSGQPSRLSMEVFDNEVVPSSEVLVNAHKKTKNMSGQPSRLSMEVFDNEVVPSSLKSIAPILRVASEIQNERPRVAYLCRHYAFEKAHRLDPTSSGRGVRRFRTGLFQQLERDDAPSLAARVEKTDAREILSFYKQYYEHYVLALNMDCVVDRAELVKAYQTAGVLFEVLCAVNKTEKVDQVSAEFLAAAVNDVQANREIYAPYNSFPWNLLATFFSAAKTE